VCDHWNYALIFWTDEISVFNERNGVQIGNEEKIRITNVIKRDHPQDFAQSPNLPVLFTQSTNWKGRAFINMLEQLKSQEKPPNWQKDVDREVKNHAKEYEYLCSDPAYLERYRNDLLLDAQAKWEASLLANWRDRIRKTVWFKKPYLINMHKVLYPEKTYFLPIFLKPGRNHFLIRGPRNTSSSTT